VNWERLQGRREERQKAEGKKGRSEKFPLLPCPPAPLLLLLPIVL